MNILLGVSGSIAAYRSPDFLKDLLGRGHEAEIVLSDSARRFVTPLTLETFLEKKVLSSDTFDIGHLGTEHIDRARWADLVLVYGATANTLARLAHGFADDFLSLQILACEGPLVLAPAMNPTMWKNPAVQANVALLRERGFLIVGPIAGLVACGESGVGHLADHDEILDLIEYATETTRTLPLKGKKILISAGPMQSPLDAARKLVNRSSGRMGLALARQARHLGAHVKLVLGPVDHALDKGYSSFEQFRFTSPQEYGDLLSREFSWADIFLSAAAVLDFEFLMSPTKLSRQDLAEHKFLPQGIQAVPDFVAKMGRLKRPDQKIIAFALESGSEEEILSRSQEKRKRKGCSAIIANPLDPAYGPDSSQNKVWLCEEDKKPILIGPASKSRVAELLLINLDL